MFTQATNIKQDQGIYLLYLCSGCNLAREAVVSQNCMHYSQPILLVEFPPLYRSIWLYQHSAPLLALLCACGNKKVHEGFTTSWKEKDPYAVTLLFVSIPSCPAATITAVSVTFLLHWTKVMWGYGRGVWRWPQCGPGDSGRPVSSRLASVRSRWWLIASVLIVLDSLQPSHQIWNIKLPPNVWSASLVESFSVQLFTGTDGIEAESWQMRDTFSFSSSSWVKFWLDV